MRHAIASREIALDGQRELDIIRLPVPWEGASIRRHAAF